MKSQNIAIIAALEITLADLSQNTLFCSTVCPFGFYFLFLETSYISIFVFAAMDKILKEKIKSTWQSTKGTKLGTS